MDDSLQNLKNQRNKLREMGGDAAVKKQHKQGKLTARERISALVDENSFFEFGQFVQHRCSSFGLDQVTIPSDAVVTGTGRIDDRPVYLFAQDFTSHGGTMGEMGAKKICDMLDKALQSGVPVIGIMDSGGARIQEGVDALSGYGNIFYRNVQCSGKIPQISIMAGPCAGGATYSPALTDFIIMVEHTSKMFVTGPAVVASISGEKVSAEELGSAQIHACTSGVAHFLAKDDQDAITTAKKLLSYLPSSSTEQPPVRHYQIGDESRDILNTLYSKVCARQYDIHDVISQIVDPDSFMEVHALFAQNVVVGFARMAGQSVGIVANQPNSLDGYLDIDASDKAARFVQFCDAFNVPLITLVDVPGFYPGTQQEHAGVIRHGAKMLHTYAAAKVPKITITLGKAYGGGYLAMCCKHLGADVVFAWPSAQVAVMGAEGAVDVLFRKELSVLPKQEAVTRSAQLIKEYRNKFDSPFLAASRGYIDAVVLPSETRTSILAALNALSGKKRNSETHRNMPL